MVTESSRTKQEYKITIRFLGFGIALILSLELLSCNPFILIADSWRKHIRMISPVISSVCRSVSGTC